MRDWRAALAAIPVALVAVALAEACQVPLRFYEAAPASFAAILAGAMAYACVTMSVPVLYQLGIVFVRRRAERGRTTLRREIGAAWVLSAAVVGVLLAVLFIEQAFRRYWPFWALHALLFAFLGWVATCAARAQGRGAAVPEARWARRVRQSIGPFSVVTAIFAYAANAHVYPEGYPTLHLNVIQVAYLFLHVALAECFRVLRLRKRWKGGVGGVALGAAGVLALGVVATSAGLTAGVRPQLLRYTVLGKSRAILVPGEDELGERPRIRPDPEAVDRFARQSGLPTLPAGFRLADYNVLLIVGESVRFDQTSLADPQLGTTPNLLRWVNRNRPFVFTFAYSPAAGTLQTVASLFSMTFAAAAPVDLRRNRAFLGELRQEARTVAEALSHAGYRTFWIGHDYRGHFRRDMLGLDQGFAFRRLRPVGRDTGTVDREIVDWTIERLMKMGEARFFGWVFLVSPHNNYLAHYADMPSKRPLDRFRQELRFLDEQTGRLLEFLDTSGLARRTIVIFLGDHGEAFGEHGARFHSRSIHNEVTRVALAVRIPRLAGERLSRPTSLSYLFPWLFLHGTAEMRRLAGDRLRRDIGPMLRETDGAVVVERIKARRTLSSLVYPEHKINYDWASGSHEVFDLVRDPGETVDLYGSDPALASQSSARMRSYRRARAGLRRYRWVQKGRPMRDHGD